MTYKGVWLDRKQAHIITLINTIETCITIPSGIEHFRVRGGSGTRLKGGPQDVVQDSKYLEREKHQLKAYFKVIATEIKQADAIVLLGPANIGEKLNKELKTHYKAIGSKVKSVKKTDRMTENQIKAWIRDFFLSAV